MDLLLAFLLFLIAMVGAIICGYSMLIALFVGLICFFGVGLHRKFSFRELTKMGISGLKDSIIVIIIMCVIGMLTATWRMCGTITVFVYYGIRIITPKLFLLITFFLTTVLSYAIGTSFGVAGTAGVLFMSIARFGGVDPVMTAGVLMSGIYFGDRGSPASSAAALVAGLTHTEMMSNVKRYMKSAILPMAICTVVYTILSVTHPLSEVDPELVENFEEAFNLSLWAFLPAVVMLALPLLRVSILKSMLASIVTACLVGFFVQGAAPETILSAMVTGYEAPGEGLGQILNGGGFVSMLEVAGILAVSSAYSGIFDGTGMLDGVQDRLTALCRKRGKYPVISLLALASGLVFCNQTMATLIGSNLMTKPYLDLGADREELAEDMANSVLVISCLVPWCIGCSVPLSFLQAPYACIGYACYMYLVPICYFFTKKKRYGGL